MMGWVGGWDGIEFLKVRWGVFDLFFSEVAKEYTPKN